MAEGLDRLSAHWFVKPGDVVFDVGVYRGETAMMYLDRGASAVYGFEPLPANGASLPERLTSDPRFHLLPCALAAVNGRQNLIVPRRNNGGGTLSSDFFRWIRREPDDEGSTHAVETRALDDLDLPRANFWKIDIEGAELAVLRGVEATIRRSPPDVVQAEIFLSDRTLYLNTLDYIKARFQHFWAIGAAPDGRLLHYDVTSEAISSRDFHEALARCGTPHFYASSVSFWDWIGRLPAGPGTRLLKRSFPAWRPRDWRRPRLLESRRGNPRPWCLPRNHGGARSAPSRTPGSRRSTSRTTPAASTPTCRRR